MKKYTAFKFKWKFGTPVKGNFDIQAEVTVPGEIMDQ
jgi:hypothetical protein